jgi:hypothetical protein
MKKSSAKKPAANFVNYCTLAQIRVAYILAFDCEQPGDMPFIDAGRAAQKELAAKGEKLVPLFERIGAAIKEAGIKTPYTEIAARVKAGQ